MRQRAGEESALRSGKPCVEKNQRDHADRDGAEINLDLPGMESRHQPAQSPSPGSAAINAGVDPAFVESRGKPAKHSADSADQSDKSIPEEAIHPAGDQSGGSA